MHDQTPDYLQGLSLSYFLRILLKFSHDLELRWPQSNREHVVSIENNGGSVAV